MMIIEKSPQVVQMLCVRQVRKADLRALEWDGEYIHYRRIYLDAFNAAQRGDAVLWIADIPDVGIIGQIFISLRSSRQELADGSTRAYIYGFRVRPAFRNLGVGTRIVRHVEKDLLERGFTTLTLNVGKGNLSALRFYSRLGFQIVHSDPGCWSYLDHDGIRRSVKEPAWRMEKTIIHK